MMFPSGEFIVLILAVTTISIVALRLIESIGWDLMVVLGFFLLPPLSLRGGYILLCDYASTVVYCQGIS